VDNATIAAGILERASVLEETITALPERVGKSNETTTSQEQDRNERAQYLTGTLELALGQRNRRAFSAQARNAREQQFTRDAKAVMKEVTAAAGAEISDRRLRKDMRVRLYADLMVVTKRLNAEHARLADRARKATYWSVASTGAASIVVLGVVLWALQHLRA
jgi:hypothetical protein